MKKPEDIKYMVAVLVYDWERCKGSENPFYCLSEKYNNLDHRGRLWTKEETIRKVQWLEFLYPNAEEIRITPLYDGEEK